MRQKQEYNYIKMNLKKWNKIKEIGEFSKELLEISSTMAEQYQIWQVSSTH